MCRTFSPYKIRGEYFSLFEGIMEIWERSGRDEKNPSRAQTLYTKAFPAIMGGMRIFFAKPANLQKVSLIFEDSCQTCCNSD